MNEWETDNEVPTTASEVAASLTVDNVYGSRASSLMSNGSKRRSLAPPGWGPSYTMTTDRNEKRSSRDIANDESISILDPRRFTPTLHANLVSEILSLRRDQEEKTRQIDTLETALHSLKQEHERLRENLTNTSKESRSLKRQLALLEGGTSSALGELARERDEAVDSITDAKKRLEAAQKKIRSQEDDSKRDHDLWAQEKDDWMDQRRNFERKLHTAESRLKMVLDEVAAYQMSQTNGTKNTTLNDHVTSGDDSGAEDDATSVRTMSRSNSIRHSLLNGLILQAGSSLADELNFDDDDQTDADGRESVLSYATSPKHTRSWSRDSGFGRFSVRNQNIESMSRPGSVARRRLFINSPVPEAIEGEDQDTDALQESPAVRTCYTDTGVQYSPPPSPEVLPRFKSPALDLSPQHVKAPESDSLIRVDGDVEANQSRKRVQLSRPLIIEPPKAGHRMISSFAQTVVMPLSPPRTPHLSISEKSTLESAPTPMVTASTQTDEPVLVSTDVGTLTSGALPRPPPLQIPTISIQPPGGCPTTPREPRLPQHFKHFGCQVSLSSSISTCDVGVQTEGIQVDKRVALLPPHLQPSSISSRPPSPNASKAGLDEENSSLASRQEENSFLGLTDEQALPNKRTAKRTNRFSSMLAGFDTANSDEAEELGTCTEGVRSFYVDAAADKENHPKGHDRKWHWRYEKAAAAPAPTTNGGGSSTAIRTGAFRRVAMLHSGLSSQKQSRSRSPSLPELNPPPFPIPKRASSRPLHTDVNAASDGGESPTRGEVWLRRGSSRSSHHLQSIRKVRSAATLAWVSRSRRRGSGSPPLSPSTEALGSPVLPPLPQNDITTPRTTARFDRAPPTYRRHRQDLSTNTNNTQNTALTTDTGASQTTGVVDAMAQAMVGEWMLKYVRRRKSFGVDEGSGKNDSGNDRHKRWVWLAPYERSILWNNKQPLSGSALLGKSGRKLTIQSVLDVKDDNPAPKVMPTVFSRSILILTPQRALKFTTSCAERHYLWLTALSFLAHSSQAVPDNIPKPCLPKPRAQQMPEYEPRPRRIKRGGIRDSIGLAKMKSSMAKAGMSNVPSAASVGSSSRKSETTGSRGPDASSGISGGHSREQSREAAEPPFVPRFSERSAIANAIATHGRKRSNTGGHVGPPLAFRGFSGPAGSGGGGGGPQRSVHSTGRDNVDTIVSLSSDMYQTHGSTNTGWNMSQTASQRTSEASSRRGNFFDAIGTVRMEAFVSPLSYSQNNESRSGGIDSHTGSVRRRSRDFRRRHSRTRRGDFYKGNYQIEEDGCADPFKGF